MEVHAPKITSRTGIPCSGLISLLKKSADIVPMGIRGFYGGVYWSHHLRAARTNDRAGKEATIRVGPTDMKGQTNPLKDHETMFILTLGDKNAGAVA